jgi:hypothetical protein
MGDGSFRGSSITLYTNNFTIQEVVLLISILRYKFQLEANLHLKKAGNKYYPTIYITSNYLPHLINLVKPYMVNYMYYKLGIK